MVEVYHRGEVLCVVLLFHCEALLVKRDCWSWFPPLIQSVANPRKDVRSPVEIGDGYQSSLPNRIQKHRVIFSAQMPSMTGMLGVGVAGCESTQNKWPFMWLGGHLQSKGGCKVYGYPCSFLQCTWKAFILSVHYSGGRAQGHIVFDTYVLHSDSL